MRKAAILLFITLIIVGIGAGLFGSSLWGRLHDPFKGYPGAEQFVEVPQGTSTGAIGRRLVDAGVVRDPLVFRVALWWTGESRGLKAGEYRFDAPLSVIGVVERLARGDVYARRITFPEGLTMREMARLFESRGFGAARDFIAAAGNEMLIADLDARASDLEGYLFPDTYALPRGTAAARLVAQMVGRFRSTYSEELRRLAAEQGMSTREVVALASLVEKETGTGDERALVSAVYRNRLRIGMGLQADPTVVYALQVAGTYDGNIRREDLAFDSPYNTYKYRGLPPGPIASPGKASLEAALAPADVPYLYFVSRNDGTHAFASTLDEHNRNVREWQVEYFRRR